MKIKIQGEDWTVLVVETDKFIKKCGDGIAGITTPDTKTILLCEDDLNKELIAHELAHAYFHYTCTSAATLDNDQLEEIWCELIAKYGSTIHKQTNKIYRELKS